MAFAMKGGEGGSRGGLECHIPILKNDFFENHHSLTVKTCFALGLGFILCIYGS